MRSAMAYCSCFHFVNAGRSGAKWPFFCHERRCGGWLVTATCSVLSQIVCLIPPIQAIVFREIVVNCSSPE